jgi:beta-N-acetylhexosaminidase
MKRYRTGLAIVLMFAVVGSGAGPVAPASAAPAAPRPAAAQPFSMPMAIGAADGSVSRATDPTFEQLVGQKLVITMAGYKPSTNLLGRVRRGEIGGVVLLGSNITTRAALVSLTGKLQAAAAAGGQPPLLIAVDQEGGYVKRVSWAPPTITVPEMGRIGSTSVARTQGAKTGAALRGLGINVDFAPVADVPRSTTSFMYQQGRTFSFDATLTAKLADAFAAGLASKGVLATMKHFPGIGLAKKNTDHYVDTIAASRAVLAPDLRPYRKAIRHDIPLIMLSNVTYTAYDPDNAAGWSSAIAVTLLRQDLGFTGVTITDSLSGTAHARGLTVKLLAVRAAMAGTDMILMTGSEKSSRALYATLLAAAKDGSIPVATLRASYDRILALKAPLGASAVSLSSAAWPGWG